MRSKLQVSWFDRTAQQYEQAVRGDVHAALTNTAEIVRANLVAQSLNVEQQSELHFSFQQMTLLIELIRASERTLGNQRQIFV